MNKLKHTEFNFEIVKLYDFSINNALYESEFNKKYNIVLSKIKNNQSSGLTIKPNVFSKNAIFDSEDLYLNILEPNKLLPDFFSMYIDNKTTLFKHINFIYESSYIHYAWAKEKNLGNSFPHYACGYSSANLLLYLMKHGYVNASIIANDAYDHAYVALPFFLNETNSNGFIIVDPTSDQLFDRNFPRNNIFITFSKKWRYTFDKNGVDMYPDKDSSFVNLSVLKKYFDFEQEDFVLFAEPNAIKYINNVFNSVIHLDIKH